MRFTAAACQPGPVAARPQSALPAPGPTVEFASVLLEPGDCLLLTGAARCADRLPMLLRRPSCIGYPNPITLPYPAAQAKLPGSPAGSLALATILGVPGAAEHFLALQV
jgi:hypothetical protein